MLPGHDSTRHLLAYAIPLSAVFLGPIFVVHLHWRRRMGYEMLSGAGMPSPLGASVLLHRTLVSPAAELGAGRPSVCTFLSADLPESLEVRWPSWLEYFLA